MKGRNNTKSDEDPIPHFLTIHYQWSRHSCLVSPNFMTHTLYVPNMTMCSVPQHIMFHTPVNFKWFCLDQKVFYLSGKLPFVFLKLCSNVLCSNVLY